MTVNCLLHPSNHRSIRFDKPTLGQGNSSCLLVFILFTLSIPGCGTLLHGGNQELTFDSKPPGVSVILDDGVRFTTPHTIALPRSSNHHATFIRDGYETQRVVIKHDFLVGASIIGNILPLFPVGFAIDVVTGAAWGFQQDYIAIDMTKKAAQQ